MLVAVRLLERESELLLSLLRNVHKVITSPLSASYELVEVGERSIVNSDALEILVQSSSSKNLGASRYSIARDQLCESGNDDGNVLSYIANLDYSSMIRYVIARGSAEVSSIVIRNAN